MATDVHDLDGLRAVAETLTTHQAGARQTR
jgi:hypothetical protein